MDLESQIKELHSDLAALHLLVNDASRDRIRVVLNAEIMKVNREIANLEGVHHPLPVINESSFAVKLTRYAWGQDEKCLKIYVYFEKTASIVEKNCHCMFSPRSVKLFVKQVDGKDYFFTINNLLHDTDPIRSKWSIRPGLIQLNITKTSAENWECVTLLEKKSPNPTKEDEDVDPDDPAAGVMNLMKKMYIEGDDDMKRTIAKAWHASQQHITTGKPAVE